VYVCAQGNQQNNQVALIMRDPTGPPFLNTALKRIRIDGEVEEHQQQVRPFLVLSF
jgi:hypothetical protein